MNKLNKWKLLVTIVLFIVTISASGCSDALKADNSKQTQSTTITPDNNNMLEQFRTPERYRFIKGVITQISESSVSIIPYGEINEVEGFFVPGVTEFWKGGLNHIREVSGHPGDQGTMGAFTDDSGKLLIETLYINHQQIRGKIIAKKKDVLVIQHEEKPGLEGLVTLITFHKDAVTNDNIPVDMNKINIGQSVIVQGEMVGPNLLDVYRIEFH